MTDDDFEPPPGGAWPADVGLVVEELTGVAVRGWLDVGDRHHTPWGVVHGGVYATVVETAASLGASAAVADRGQVAVGLTNSTDFLRSMTSGRLEVVALPVVQGRTQQVWTVDLRRKEDGALVAQGRLRLQNVELAGLRR